MNTTKPDRLADLPGPCGDNVTLRTEAVRLLKAAQERMRLLLLRSIAGTLEECMILDAAKDASDAINTLGTLGGLTPARCPNCGQVGDHACPAAPGEQP